jgi:hypothetical protein
MNLKRIRAKKMVIPLLLLLVVCVGLTLTRGETAGPVDQGNQIDQPAHVFTGMGGDQGGPGGNGDPGVQGGPGTAIDPGTSADPAGPADPVNPTDSDNPPVSDNPVGPGTPADPVNPPVSDNPADPANPVDPGDQKDPVNPAIPDDPTVPGTNDVTPPIPTPEFPSALLPATFIIGCLGAVLLIRRNQDI